MNTRIKLLRQSEHHGYGRVLGSTRSSLKKSLVLKRLAALQRRLRRDLNRTRQLRMNDQHRS
jgi:hypothetical protein